MRREVGEHLKAARGEGLRRARGGALLLQAVGGGRGRDGVYASWACGGEFLLAVGTIEPRKNLATLVRAFEDIVRERSSSQLRLVLAGGRGWLTGPLFESIERSPARGRVVLTGYVSDEQLRALYSACRVFVYPSFYEGFGLPPLEAMGCGAAVVAGRTPATEEVTDGAARLFDPRDPAELARTLLELLDQDEARRALSEAGLARAAHFSWERAARATLDVYEEALKEGVGSRQ